MSELSEFDRWYAQELFGDDSLKFHWIRKAYHKIKSLEQENERLKELLKDIDAPECTNCPECHTALYVNKNYLGKGFRQCAKCGQEWWTDINYGKIDLHTKPLVKQNAALQAELSEARELSKSYLAIADRYADTIASLSDKAEAAERRVKELEADCAVMAESVIHDHYERPWPAGLDWGKCECPACQVAYKYLTSTNTQG